MADKLSISLPGPGDFQAIATLTNLYIRETAIHFGLEELDAASYQRSYEQDRVRFPWLVARWGGDFAGYAKSRSWRDRGAYNKTIETAVYVDERFHRKGIARALYTALLGDLRSRGFHCAVAGITLPNDASVRFHEALGFVHVGTFCQVGRKFDKWHDVAFFKLMLE